MNARILDKRITIERKESTRDPIGQPIDAWVVVATVWANIKYPSGKEFVSADRQTAETVASMRIRKREIDNEMRIRIGSDIYEITAVLQDGNRFINLATKKVE